MASHVHSPYQSIEVSDDNEYAEAQLHRKWHRFLALSKNERQVCGCGLGLLALALFVGVAFESASLFYVEEEVLAELSSSEHCPALNFSSPLYNTTYRTPSQIVGYEWGQRQANLTELETVLEVLANQSDRVLVGSFGKSSAGLPLIYAFVSSRNNLAKITDGSLQAVLARLRDPRNTSADTARELSRDWPAVAWVVGNTHGDEPSGADAAVQIVYELSARQDEQTRTILNNLVVVVVPIQNPDGRAENTRRNAHGFDLNRDWFVQTQAETQAKLHAMARLPPLLFLDLHEMLDIPGYFFPPNADPLYHELAGNQTIHSIKNIYGEALKKEFQAQNISYFNEKTFDLFFPGYGDTLSTSAFMSAGITLEQGNPAEYLDKVCTHSLAVWVSLHAAATLKISLLEQWYRQYAEALEQGKAGVLQPNQVLNAQNGQVQAEVPPGLLVRQYWLLPETDKAEDLSSLLTLLARLGVEVDQLREDLLVEDFRWYGHQPQQQLVPAGAFRVSLAQPQKHLIQYLLCENTYSPIPYWFDATGWSLPLLFNVAAGYSSLALTLPFSSVRLQSNHSSDVFSPIPFISSLSSISILPNVLVLASSSESNYWLTFVLRQWGIQFGLYQVSELVDGAALARLFDVILIADIYDGNLKEELLRNTEAVRAIRDFVRLHGKRLVAYGHGAYLTGPEVLGLSENRFIAPSSDCPGVLVRATFTQTDSSDIAVLTKGAGNQVMVYYEYNDVMLAGASAAVVAEFPPYDGTDSQWFVHGYQQGAQELSNTAFATLEEQGSGSVVLFSSEMLWRASTIGTAKLLANAVTSWDQPHEQALSSYSSAAAATARQPTPDQPASSSSHRTQTDLLPPSSLAPLPQPAELAQHPHQQETHLFVSSNSITGDINTENKQNSKSKELSQLDALGLSPAASSRELVRPIRLALRGPNAQLPAQQQQLANSIAAALHHQNIQAGLPSKYYVEDQTVAHSDISSRQVEPRWALILDNPQGWDAEHLAWVGALRRQLLQPQQASTQASDSSNIVMHVSP
eukprot:gb/GEZN01000879.1/.p1 GENE.gb/GEZN01000879.1/~~gb/GEZN01000879.1/.p1  ORF type:complete len:1029 (-),score=186.09 gb/GEZN01000879.1/:287-3373(-)